MAGTGCQPIPTLMANMNDTRHPVREINAIGGSASNKTEADEHAPKRYQFNSYPGNKSPGIEPI